MTTSREQLLREQFEAWAKKQRLSLTYGDCGYVFSSTEMAWRAWQASRAELVVELPEMVDYELLDEKSVKASLSAAGITVKGDS